MKPYLMTRNFIISKLENGTDAVLALKEVTDEGSITTIFRFTHDDEGLRKHLFLYTSPHGETESIEELSQSLKCLPYKLTVARVYVRQSLTSLVKTLNILVSKQL